MIILYHLQNKETKIFCFVFKVITRETPATTKRSVPSSSLATSSTNPTISTPSPAFKATTTSLLSSKGTTPVTKGKLLNHCFTVCSSKEELFMVSFVRLWSYPLFRRTIDKRCFFKANKAPVH